MRKILNLVLVFVLSIMVVGIASTGVNAAATEDVTITVHVHQFDGVYTNTGIGVWDNVTWNGWGALQSSVDDFGAVVVLNYTAAEINAVMDNIQFEITSESVAGAGGDDGAAQAGILSPGDGKTFLDVTSLKDGSVTELEVYYVEGATSFVAAADGFGQIFFVYADPTVAANVNVYDEWTMWTWNNGTLGTEAGPGDDEGVPWSADMVQNTGTYDVAMKLGVFNVAADADASSGFIVRTDLWVKQCGTDIMVDNSTIRGSGTLVYYYQADSCELETDGAAFLADIDTKFEMNAGNRFMETNVISSPTTVEVELLMPQNPGAYDVSRFTLKDVDGVTIPLVSAQASTMGDLGVFTSDVTCAANENKFILYVNSTLDHALLGVVGSLQGWSPDNAVMSTKDDENGNAVFEICTTQVAGEYKVLLDPDDDGFTWDGNVDPNVTADNQSFDFGGERMGYFYVDANVPTVSNDFVGTFVSDYTPLVDEKVLIIHFDTDKARDMISVVGSFVQSWAPAASADPLVVPYISTKDDTSGYAVFEVPSMEATGEFKILFDAGDDVLTLDVDESGFNWGDEELTVQLAYDFGDADTLEIFINADGTVAYIVGGTAVSTPLETTMITLAVDVADELQPGSDYFVDYEQLAIENHVSIYVSTDLDHTMIGIVGSLQGWDIANPLMSTQDSSLGYAVFEFVTTDTSGEFKVIYNDGVDDVDTADVDESGFNWGDFEVTPGDNVAFEVGSSGVLVLLLEPTPTMDVGTFTSDFTPADEIYGTDLFFSHYSDGDGGSCKFIELYNPTASDIDLSTYTIIKGGNGTAFDASSDIETLTGTLASGAVIVVGNPACWGTTDTAVVDHAFPQDGYAYIESTVVGYINGDDALGLFNNSVLIDTIGLDGIDPGTGWDVGNGDLLGGTTANVTLTRIASVTDGETDWAVGAMQWVVSDSRDYATVGTHTADYPFPAEKTVILHLDTALLGTDISVVGEFIQVWDPASGTPYTSTKVDSDGYAVFELPTILETGEFKILHDNDGTAGFSWDDAELTIQLRYTFISGDTVEYVINAAGDVMTYATGYAGSVVGQVITDMALVGDITQELFAAQYQTEVVESNLLPYGLSNNFVVGDVTAETGTYAIDYDTIALGFLSDPTLILSSLDLLENGDILPINKVTLAAPGIGTYTETVTCEAAKIKLMAHIYLTTEVTTLAQLGLVGDVQGWDIGATIAPTGMDSNGNYVFEVCVDDTTETGAFKVKFDPDSDGFGWDSVADPEMTPGDILFDFSGTLTSLYVEEGQSAYGTSVNHVAELYEQEFWKIEVGNDYQLRFIDENGFIVLIDLNIDDEAPEIQAAFVVDVVLEIDQGETFDIMDYFTQLLFLDNRDGEMTYEITTDLDTDTPGEQTVVISATDMWNNVGTAEYVFTVIDVVAPVITLDDAPTFNEGDTEPDWAIYASTNEGTLVIGDSQVDMAVAGTFFVSYTATDDAGNVTSESLEVTIEAVETPEDDSGCFGSIGSGSAFIIFGVAAVLGGAALFFIRKP